jgi:hypothetical protein
MPENYIFMMDYEKKENLLELKQSLKSLYYLLDFTKYLLSVNTNSGVFALTYMEFFLYNYIVADFLMLSPPPPRIIYTVIDLNGIPKINSILFSYCIFYIV